MKVSSFFSANRQYVVVGASSNAHKFGFIVTKWYADRDLNVTPVNPKASTILNCEAQPTISKVMTDFVAAENGMDGISVSFLTPPSVSSNIIREITQFPNYKLLIKGLWLQPGSYDEQVLQMAFEAGLQDRVLADGKCILVEGDRAMRELKL